MKQNIWIYEQSRTNPGRIHHKTGDGNITAVVEILREGDVDLVGRDAVEFRKVTPVHLGTDQNTWRFGPNGEWLGPHGILFVYEDEYEDPHGLFARLEAIREAGPQASAITTPLDLSGVESDGRNAAPAIARSAPAGPPEPDFDPADLDHSGSVSGKERRLHEGQTHHRHEK